MMAGLDPHIRGNFVGYLVHLLTQVAHELHMMAALRRVSGYLNGVRALALNAHVVPQVLAAIPPKDGVVPSEAWSVQRVAKSVSDVTVLMVGPKGQEPSAVVKLARTQPARLSFRQRSAIIAALQADKRLCELRGIIPLILAQGEVDEYAYRVEKAVRGKQAGELIRKPLMRQRIHTAAAQLLVKIHHLTAVPTIVDESLLSTWVDQPCTLLQQALSSAPCGKQGDSHQAITRLRNELRAKLAGRTIAIGWMHGDYALGNLFVSPDGSEVVGLIDWELARPEGVAILDLLWLSLSMRVEVERRELGEIMQELLQGGDWLPYEEQRLQEAQTAQFGGDIDRRSLLLLCWLHHVASTLAKSEKYARHCYWLSRNVRAVLASL